VLQMIIFQLAVSSKRLLVHVQLSYIDILRDKDIRSVKSKKLCQVKANKPILEASENNELFVTLSNYH